MNYTNHNQRLQLQKHSVEPNREPLAAADLHGVPGVQQKFVEASLGFK